jgi:hypothetical protein
MCYEACPALSAVYTHRGQFAGRAGRVEYRRSLGYRDQLNIQNGEIVSSVDESDANYVARCEGVARLLGAIFHHKYILHLSFIFFSTFFLISMDVLSSGRINCTLTLCVFNVPIHCRSIWPTKPLFESSISSRDRTRCQHSRVC